MDKAAFSKQSELRSDFELIITSSTDSKLDKDSEGDYLDREIQNAWLEYLNINYSGEIRRGEKS